jgi:hypothetical protein
VAAQPGHRARRRHPRDEPGARFGGQYGAAGRGAALPHADRNRGNGPEDLAGAERRPGAPPGTAATDRGRSASTSGRCGLRLCRRGRLQRGRGRDRRAAQPAHVLALPPDDRRAT